MKEILGHFGKILKDLGTKVDNSMIPLNYLLMFEKSYITQKLL